jgi:transmembrane sensor
VTDFSDSASELDPLTREALAWVVRLKSGEATSADAEALQQWQARSPAHAQAFREAVRLWRALGPAAAEIAREQASAVSAAIVPPARPPRPSVGRRAVLGGAAVAAAAASYLVVRPPLRLWPSLEELSADYRTGKGEQRKVALASDISLDMNTQTSIAVRSMQDEPRIELISGEAAITTRLAPGKPLSVIAADGRMVAAIASFNARCDDGLVLVTCLDGEVEVERGSQAVRLRSGQQVSYSAAGLGASAMVDTAQETSWQARLLVFRDRPLAQVIDEVNRYRPGKIIVTNSELGRRLVNGTFHLDRLEEVIAQVRQLFGASVTALPGGIVLLS